MRRKTIKVEHLLYGVAFLIGIGLRVTQLDVIPLNEYEADWAVQAFRLAGDSSSFIGSQPVYVILTGFIFNIFGSSDILARILPALAGSLFVLLPMTVSKYMGKPAALVAAFGLALDPGMVSLSRMAGGQMMALAFGLFAFAAWLRGLHSVSGVLGAMAVMSAPAILPGFLGVGAAVYFSNMVLNKSIKISRRDLRKAMIAAGISFLLVGTFFLRSPQGLSGIGSVLSDYIQGWTQSSGVSVFQMVLGLWVYQPLGLLFGLLAMFGVFKSSNRAGQFLGLWFVTSLFLTLIYPNRQIGDLIWVLTPLWGLAGIYLARYIPEIGTPTTFVVWGHAILVIVLLIFGWINLSERSNLTLVDWALIQSAIQNGGLSSLDPNSLINITRLFIAWVIPVIILVSTYLVGANWSRDEAEKGLVWGVVLILGLYLLSASWGSGHIRSRASNELWSYGPAAGYTPLVLDTIEDLAELNFGSRIGIDVAYQLDSSMLEWTLRDFPNTSYSQSIDPDELPSIVITAQVADEPILNRSYRGQSIPWQIHRNWGGDLPANFLDWYIYRQAPTFPENLILWARADMFPAGSLLEEPVVNPSVIEEGVEEEDGAASNNQEAP